MSLLYGSYLVLQFLFHDEIINILNNNLPFRQAYFPTVTGIAFVYILPLLLGYYLSAATDRSRVRSYVYFINLSLTAGLFYFLPFLFFFNNPDVYWFESLAVTYSVMLFPCLFLIGCIPNMYAPFGTHERLLGELPRLNRRDSIVAASIAFLSFLINYIPFHFAQYLVGADIYYHAAMTKEIALGHSIFSSPYFLEGSNYYYSIVYYILASVSDILHINVQNVWMIYPAFCSAIFFYFFYLFSKRGLNNTFLAILACIFALTTRQLIWGDPTVRNASYVFFALFLYFFQSYIFEKKRKYLFLSVLSFILTVTSHPEVAIHIAGIVIVYSVLTRINIVGYLKLLIEYFQHVKFVTSFYAPSLDTPHVFVLQIFLYTLIFFSSVLFIIYNYSIGQILIFNEIPLSLFQPLGIISFLTFILLPVGFLKMLHNTQKNDYFLLSVSSLSLSAIFYFSYLWIFYHRYFFETAYFALAIIAAFALKDILTGVNNKYALRFLGTIAIMLFLTLYPRYIFLKQYSDNTNQNLQTQMVHLNMVREHSLPGDVIAINPHNIINRYIPFYSERYVLAGSNKISKDQQWQVFSFCNGPYSKDCDSREDAAELLFNAPSKSQLANIKNQYQVNYLLLNKTDIDEYTKFTNSDLGLILPVAEDDQYAMYKL
jgi:hypothetical protein